MASITKMGFMIVNNALVKAKVGYVALGPSPEQAFEGAVAKMLKAAKK